MKVQAINNTSNTSFNAKVNVHQEVFQSVGIKTMLNGKDPVAAGKNLKDILIKADDKIRPLLPDVSLTTIEAVLAKLIKQNKISKIGTFKNAKYIKR